MCSPNRDFVICAFARLPVLSAKFHPGSSSSQARRRRAGAVARARGWYPADRQPVRGAALCAHARRATTMSGNYMFVMVGQGDTPIYEAEFLNTQRREDTSHLNQFIIHAALDMVDETVWGTSSASRVATDHARTDGRRHATNSILNRVHVILRRARWARTRTGGFVSVDVAGSSARVRARVVVGEGEERKADLLIDATSLRSGLNNPFSPQYSVTPVMDAPPAVRWDRAIPKTLLAAPIDVLPMLVLASDDLPLDEVIQEYKVNDGPLIRRQIAIEAPNRDLQLRWDWDLMKLGGEGQPPVQLSGGDIIQTRTVAIDRKGQTGESDFIQILVAEPGFDRARHDHLIPMRLLTEAITTWADQVSEIMDLASDSKQDDLEKIANRIPELHAQNQSVIQLIKQQIESSGKSIQSSEWELLGRSVSSAYARTFHII